MYIIEFESTGKYITSWDTATTHVKIRCNSDYTDIGDTESLSMFIRRHGGDIGTTDYLLKCYREKTGYSNV